MIFGGGSVGGGAIGTGIVFTLYDQFSATSDKIATKFKTLEGISEQAANKIDSSLSKMKLGFASMVVGAGILATLAFPIDKAAEFEQGLSAIKAVSGATNAEMKILSDLSLEMGKKTKYSALESAQGIEELIKAGVSLKDVVNGGIEGALNLAAAGEIEVADAAEIASMALNAFRNDALTVTKAADILAGAANASATDISGLKMGLSQASAVASGFKMTFLDTSTASAVFAQNGLKGSDGGTSLKNMLLNLIPTTKAQIELSKKLGLVTADGANAFFDSTGKMKDLAGISDVLQKSFSGLTDEQRASAMVTLFGTDAIRASNILYKEGAKGVNDMQQAMTKFTALSVATERMNNLKGATEQMKGSFETMMIVIGSGFTKPLSLLVKGFQFLFDIVTSLASTKLGKVLLITFGIIGAGALVLGAFVLVTNLATFASGQLALAFASLGKTAIATAFAEQGLIAGTKALTASLLPLIWEFLPIIVAVASVIYLFYRMKKGFEDFNAMADGTGKKLSGISGVFQKIGGVIQAFMEIWSSATDDGFTFSDNTYKALKNMGIYEFAVNMGVAFGYIRQGFQMLGKVASAIWNVLQPIFGSIGNLIGTVAIIIGVVLVGAVIAWTASMIGAAIATLAATWPILLIIGIIIALVYVIQNFGKIWDWVVEKFKAGWHSMVEAGKSIFMEFIVWLGGLGIQFFNWGVSLVQSIGDGIISAWEWLKGEMLSLIADLPGGKILLSALGIDVPEANGTGNGGNVSGPTPLTTPSAIGTTIAQQKSVRGENTNSFTQTVEKKETLQTVKLQIDGRELKTALDKVDKEQNSRK